MGLSVGDIVEGKITSVQSFGCFVDIGDGKTGMVHISEVANTYVSEIKDFVKENDVVKLKVISIGEDGKISLSIKRALPKPQSENKERAPRKTNYGGGAPAFVPKAPSEPTSFEEMMNKFKQTSDEKFSDLKRKNPDAHRVKRGAKN